MASTLVQGPASALQSTFGAYLIGAMFSIFLQGLLTVQTWNYFENFPNDPFRLQMLVSVVWILDTFHLILVCQSVYHYLVTNWGFEAALDEATWELVIHIFLVGLSCMLCQIFFLQRIWIFSQKNYAVVGVLCTLCLASFAISIHLPANLIATHLPLSAFPSQKPEVTALFLSGAASDFLIAGLLCYYLRQDYSGFKATRSVIGKILQYAVATGLATSALRVGAVLALFVAPTKLYYIAMHLSLGRLYTNSLLATLNARKRMREVLKDSDLGVTFVLPGTRTDTTTNQEEYREMATSINLVGEDLKKRHDERAFACSFTVERITDHDDNEHIEMNAMNTP